MKKLIGLTIVLCVVAQSSFGAVNYEYKWVGTTGSFTDSANWSCTTAPQPSPALPFEDGMGGGITTTSDYSRVIVDKAGSKVTVNTDVMPAAKGFRQVQISKDTQLIIDAGGKLQVNQYLHCSNDNDSAVSGLVVKSGGTYVNTKGIGSQNGHMFAYSTAGSLGKTTLEAGSTFTANAVYLARDNGAYTNVKGYWNILGSGSTISAASILGGGGGTGSQLFFNFASDAGGISTVNVSTQLQFNGARGSTSVLDLTLGSALTEGQQLVLFDLATGATSTGKLMTKWGTTLNEGGIMDVWFGETMYGMQATYKGGETGNDVILTVVPEPATLALLSLGSLAIARRRRA